MGGAGISRPLLMSSYARHGKGLRRYTSLLDIAAFVVREG